MRDTLRARTARTDPGRIAFAPLHTSRFASRVQFQMEAMSAFTTTFQPGRELQDNVMYAELTRSVELDLRRTTRRAFRDYLMEVTTVDRWIEDLKSRGMRSVGLDTLGGSRLGKRRRVGFDLGVSHMRPEIGLDWEVGRGNFKFSVAGDGQVGVRYRNPRFGGNQVSLGFNGEDVFFVNWSVGGIPF